MCGSMVDIQSAMAENRRGRKIERKKKKKPHSKNIVSASAMQGGHNDDVASVRLFCPANTFVMPVLAMSIRPSLPGQ